ncbi:MAG: cysteine rich repeat-containing protein [Rhodomicrobium sp.]
MMRVAAPLVIAMALCLNSYAMAEGVGNRGTKDQQDACTADVYKLCSDVIPDEKKIVACLKVNAGKLTPACRKVFS